MPVHRQLGPGVDEVFYHELLSEELRATGIEHLCQPRGTLTHRGRTAAVFEPDLVFPGLLVAELKWLWGDFEPENFVQLTTYLKFWRVPDGLLLDFGKESLMQRRFVFTEKPAPPVDVAAAMADCSTFVNDRPLAQQLCQAVGAIAAQYGRCYRDTVYRGLLHADLLAEGLDSEANPVASVRAGDRRLGESKLPCLAIGNRCAVMVLSMREHIRAADRAILQSWLHHLELPWETAVNFGRHHIELRWAVAPRHSNKTTP